jgi:hypothetical protein
MSEHSALVMELLLELEPDVLTDKSAAASVLKELADVAGAISAVLLEENGEEIYQAVLKDILERIDQSARAVAERDPVDWHGGKGAMN